MAINGFDLDALNQYQMRFSFPHLFIGILPFYGPGNWFLPVVFWSILIMPLLYKGFSGNLKWRIISLILCFVVEYLVQLITLVVLILNIGYIPNFYLYYSFDNFLFHNKIYNSYDYGIRLYYSNYTSIVENEIFSS